MKILVFLHGTTIMHKNAAGHSREEIVKQVVDEEESVTDYASYIPVGNAPKKLQTWKKQGAEIFYLSALTASENAREDEKVSKNNLSKIDKLVLEKNNFPKGKIYHRKIGENYAQVIERIKPLPDVMIEDDCESIGGKSEMTHANLEPKIRAKIKSIVVKEFGGIDKIPDKISELLI